MKKLLSLLGTVGLIATSSATVVSCGDPDKGTSNNGGNDDDKTTIKELSYFLDITPEDGVYDLGSVTYNEGADKIEIPGYDGMVVLLSHVLSGLITSHVNRDHYKNGLCQIIDEFQFDFDETDPTMDYVIGNFVYQEKNVKTFEYAIT
jgi:hypothetical protein